jgi:starch phosphorylase
LERSATTHNDGLLDVQRAAEDLAGRLPPALAPLARLAYNYRWSWLPGGPELFASVDPQRFELCNHNPGRLLQETPVAVLARAAEDERLLRRAVAIEEQVDADLSRPPLRSQFNAAHPVAFLCASTACTCPCRSTRAASARWPGTCSRRRRTARCRS